MLAWLGVLVGVAVGVAIGRWTALLAVAPAAVAAAIAVDDAGAAPDWLIGLVFGAYVAAGVALGVLARMHFAQRRRP